MVVASIINNEPLTIDKDRMKPVISASSGATLHYYQNADNPTCNQACEAAWKAFQTWKHESVANRRHLLHKFCDAIKERTVQLVGAMSLETSCQEPIAFMNVELAIETVLGFSSAITEIRGLIPPHDDPGKTTFVFKESIGPVLAIVPWNTPLFLAVRTIVGMSVVDASG